MAQNFKNHTRFNPLHHFVITPISLVLLILSIITFFKSDESNNQIALLFVIAAILLLLIALIARLYSLKLQDRLIRLEMRQRYFELTGNSFRKTEEKLKLGQIIALRFAGDEELLPLIEIAIQEGLSNSEIKKRISSWQADNLRV